MFIEIALRRPRADHADGREAARSPRSCSSRSMAARGDPRAAAAGRVARLRARDHQQRPAVHADRLGPAAHRLGRGGDRQRDRADLGRAARDLVRAERAGDRPPDRRDRARARRGRRARRAHSRRSTPGRSPARSPWSSRRSSTRSRACSSSARPSGSTRSRSRPRRCSARRVALLPFGLAQAPHEVPGWEAIASVVALGVAGTGVGILIFMKIISDYGPFKAGLVTYLLPVTALRLRRVAARRGDHRVDGRRPRADPRRRRARLRGCCVRARTRRSGGACAPVNVTIRRARPDDVEFLVALTSHDDVDPFLSARRATSRDELLEEIERSEREPEDFGRFIVEVDGSAPASWASPSRTSAAGSRSSAASPSTPTSAAARSSDEAARLLQRHLMDDLGYHRLELRDLRLQRARDAPRGAGRLRPARASSARRTCATASGSTACSTD